MIQEQEWFKDWFNSPYYHLLYKNRDEVEAIAFIQRLIQHLKPLQNSKLLDIACGKGRHSKALADMGFDVTGIDISSDSIAAAKQFESDNLHFEQHDMRLNYKHNYFDVAFNFFTSFGYFKTQEEHQEAIKTMTTALKEEGLLVIDYLNVHFEETHFEKLVEKKIENYLFISTKWHTDTHFFKQVQVADNEHALPRHLSTERVAKFNLGDFNEMLSLQDMQIQEVFGDYQLGHYDIHESPRMIIVAKKRAFK
ncbi:MAG: class I SAM-dependent methyltransferase [Chitinophagaceae bacterium]|nr:class I SAM-dependent methyltransferase [Chitinophagaceae bacterium]